MVLDRLSVVLGMRNYQMKIIIQYYHESATIVQDNRLRKYLHFM